MLLRKERIIHEAFRLFCQKGIDKASMKDIAKMAKVSEKSVYRYFLTKKDLVVEIVSKLWKEIVYEMASVIDNDYKQKTGYEQIEILLRGFRHLFENHSDYILLSYDYKLYLIRQAAYVTAEEYRDDLQLIHELYIEALKKGIEDGSIAFYQNPEDIYLTIWGLMRGYVIKIVLYDYMYEGENMWKKRFDTACALILRGLKAGIAESTEQPK